MMKQNKSKLE